jgi:uncharacterized protein (TIGR02145 family)
MKKKIIIRFIPKMFIGIFLMFLSIPFKINAQLVTAEDIDGNVYMTVRIGTQTWMRENLKTTKYRNGDLIGTTTPVNKNITGESTPKYQWAYNGNESNVATFGRLYTWYAVTDRRGLCPTGWHAPTDAEWTTLTTYLGGEDVAGGKLKEKGTLHWKSPNTGASNEFGFTALPGGWRSHSSKGDYDNKFSNIGYDGSWWSATEWDENWAWYRSLNRSNIDNSREDASIFKDEGMSVRCMKD